MPSNVRKGEKKNALLAHKEKLLQEIQYYEQRIEEARDNVNKSSYFEDEASSDSDTDYLPHLVDTGPPLSQLKSQQEMLRTCLQATQELTSLELLEYEHTVLAQAPTFEGEPPITEEGTWSEVVAECCIDLVPFSINFYTFRANRKFAPLLFRALKVVPIKTAQEAELSKSVLPGLRLPSEAVEVLRSYAEASRSRRSTLARLADKFGTALYMESMAEGGYLLKCANLLEISWRLQNKWSPIAPFHHRLKFDLEYMDETSIKIITQAYRQLSDPSVDTDERTLLLAKIITTCLQEKEPESSDQDTGLRETGYGDTGHKEIGHKEIGQKETGHKETGQREIGRVSARRTTLDNEPGLPNMKHVRDSEVMAPPKCLPKKGKRKTQDNRKSEQLATKRPVEDEGTSQSAKKPRTTEKQVRDKNDASNTIEAAKNAKNVTSDKNNAQQNDGNAKTGETSVASDKNIQKNVAKNNAKSVSSTKNDKSKPSVATTKNDAVSDAKKVVNTKKTTNKIGKPGGSERNLATAKSDVNLAKKVVNAQKSTQKIEKPTSANKEVGTERKTGDKIVKKQQTKTDSNDKLKNIDGKTKVKTKNDASSKTDSEKPEKPKEIAKSDKNINKVTDDKIAKKDENLKNKVPNKHISAKVMKPVKRVANEKEEVPNKVAKKVVGDKLDKIDTKKNSTANVHNHLKEQSKKTDKNINEKPKIPTKNNVASEKTNNEQKKTKNSDVANKNIGKPANVKKSATNNDEKIKKPLNENNKIPKTANAKESNLLKPKVSTTTVKKITGNIEKENNIKNKVTKIPHKKLTPSKGVLKKMPIRVSPRKAVMKSKSPRVGANLKKIVQKTVTGIPRLLTKPKPKIL